MSAREYVNLQSSEVALLNAASTIFASYIAANKVNENNEIEMLNKSINLSFRMADIIENSTLCEEEISD